MSLDSGILPVCQPLHTQCALQGANVYRLADGMSTFAFVMQRAGCWLLRFFQRKNLSFLRNIMGVIVDEAGGQSLEVFFGSTILLPTQPLVDAPGYAAVTALLEEVKRVNENNVGSS